MTIYNVQEMSMDQDYQKEKARYKYKRGKKWNVVERHRRFVTLSIFLQQDKKVFVIPLFRRVASKEAGIKFEGCENNARAVLDAV